MLLGEVLSNSLFLCVLECEVERETGRRSELWFSHAILAEVCNRWGRGRTRRQLAGCTMYRPHGTVYCLYLARYLSPDPNISNIESEDLQEKRMARKQEQKYKVPLSSLPVVTARQRENKYQHDKTDGTLTPIADVGPMFRFLRCGALCSHRLSGSTRARYWRLLDFIAVIDLCLISCMFTSVQGVAE